MTATLAPYTRPEPDEENKLLCHFLAKKIALTPGRTEAIAKLLIENARLALECNEHRAARGFEPLPITKV